MAKNSMPQSAKATRVQAVLRSHKTSEGYRGLQQQWSDAFGCPAPKLMRSNFLERAVAWHAQMQADPAWKGQTGLNRLRKILRQAAARYGSAPMGSSVDVSKRDRFGTRSGPNSTPLKPRATVLVKSLTPGTRLVREWQGKTYQVTVLKSGFEMDHQTYPSLSAVARKITGTAWSGPLFFGLKP